MDVLIGVAWPYASGPRHLGHLAGAYLPADVAARYHRLAGDRVLLVSGSDQHGTPITVAAERAGLSPAALADRERLSLPDRYVEGTCPACRAPDARGDQCDTCGRTLDPEELGAPRCRRCGGPATLRPLRQLFLRLDLLQPEVARYLGSRERGWRPFVGAEARGWLAAGLRPRAITRDLDWGVPVPLPGWDDRRLYVWFDAVIGYLSASLEWAERHGDPDAWRAWWQSPTARHRYFVGKDNIWFHTVWWPAILLGAGDGLRPPDEVVANHHLTLSGGKLSASRGHAPTIDEGIERVGLDPLRHALCALSPETADVELAWDKVDELTASGLHGAIAGPPHRVATLLWRRFAGHPDPVALAAAEPERAEATAALGAVGAALDRGELRRALGSVHAIGRSVNRRLATTEPWRLPDPDAHRELTRLLPLLDALAVAAWPFVPTTAGRIRALLGRSPDPARWALDAAPAAVPGPPAPPMPRR
jgi:methionyl-tRNA synthetase